MANKKNQKNIINSIDALFNQKLQDQLDYLNYTTHLRPDASTPPYQSSLTTDQPNYLLNLIKDLPIAHINLVSHQLKKTSNLNENNLFMNSIKNNNYYPIIVFDDGHKYELLIGVKYYKIIRNINQATIRCLVLKIGESAKLQTSAVWNIIQKQIVIDCLNILELGIFYQKLQDVFGISEADIARWLPRDDIEESFNFLKLPFILQQIIFKGELSIECARLILPYHDNKLFLDQLLNKLSLTQLDIIQTKQLIKSANVSVKQILKESEQKLEQRKLDRLNHHLQLFSDFLGEADPDGLWVTKNKNKYSLNFIDLDALITFLKMIKFPSINDVDQ